MRLISLTVMALLLAAVSGGRAESVEFDFGPLFSRDTTVDGRTRLRILGPFFESTKTADGETRRALRPFYSREVDPEFQHESFHMLWPFWLSNKDKNHVRGLVAGCIFWSRTDVTDPMSSYCFWVIPLYFQGRSANKKPYLAVFPLGGTVRDFLGMHEAWFVMFPLVGYTRKLQNETHAFLFPLYWQTKGPSIDSKRFFPFYGYAKRKNDYDKRFILWPIWTSVRYEYIGSSGYGFILWPLFGHVGLENEQSWLFLPPFFRYDRGAKYRRLYCPWPLFQKTSGPVNKLYFFPFWGRKSMAGYKSSFILWPLFVKGKSFSDEKESNTLMLAPFIFSTSKYRKTGPDPQDWKRTARSFKLWPLFSMKSDEESSRFAMLSLWPFKDYVSVERNYGSFWTLYTHSSYKDTTEDELLWGLFRYRRAGSGKKHFSIFPLFSLDTREDGQGSYWSILKGLVGYGHKGDRKILRLFYFLDLKLGD